MTVLLEGGCDGRADQRGDGEGEADGDGVTEGVTDGAVATDAVPLLLHAATSSSARTGRGALTGSA